MKFNEKCLCRYASTQPIDYSGFMEKRGDNNKNFQRRFFILKGNLLFYFERRGAPEPLGMIVLEGCDIMPQTIDTDFQHPYCIEIVFDGIRTYVLSVDSMENMRTWMKMLNCASNEYKNHLIAELQRKLRDYEKKMSRKPSTPSVNAIGHTPAPRQLIAPTAPPPSPRTQQAETALVHLKPVLVKAQLQKTVSGFDVSFQNQPTNSRVQPTPRPSTSTKSPGREQSKSTFYCNFPETHATRSCTKSRASATAKSQEAGNLKKTPTQTPMMPGFEEWHEKYRKIVLKDFEHYRKSNHQNSSINTIHNNIKK